MPIVKEVNIQLENEPGTLAKLCKALAYQKVNILAFQASTAERKSRLHLVVDNVSAAKTVLDGERLPYTEADVAQVPLPDHPGGLARVASLLGQAKINIDYAYAGEELGTSAPQLFLGVADAGRAAKILDQFNAAAD